jgi:phage gp29-like protein
MGKNRKNRGTRAGNGNSGALARGAGQTTHCIPLHSGDQGFSAHSHQNGAPPARIGSGEAISAKDGVPAALARILRPAAAQRWTMPGLAAMTPQYIESVLRGALCGGHVQQWELFDMMLDTWPELAGCMAELTEGVMGRKVVFRSWEEDGEKPSETAEERSAVVSGALRRMRPDVAADENDFEDTLRDIADGWLRGLVCLEVDWQSVTAGPLGQVLGPRATMFAHPSHFAWSEGGWLGLAGGRAVERLPQHKFLVGIHKARAGSAMGNALLRPLAWWWCAANFASDWLLNLSQLFGLPFRWANYDPNAPQGTVDAICNMLQNMGSAGWAAFPAGTTLELKHESGSGDKSPQGDLLDRADRYARMLLLGQTMSGSQDASKGGGKAFGTVEADVKGQRVDAAAKYVAKVINGQLIPSILELNFGDREACPRIELVPDSEAGTEEAARDVALAAIMPIPVSYLQAKYGIPAAAAGEALAGQTEEGKTEDRREDDIAAKMAALAKAEDDAVFAKELRELIDTL